MRTAALVCSGLSALALVPAVTRAAEERPVPVGVAAVDITPEDPIRLIGYGAARPSRRGSRAGSRPGRWRSAATPRGRRCCSPSTTAASRPRSPTRSPARLKAKAGLPRERFVVCSTHTHCGPALSTFPVHLRRPAPRRPAGRIERYTRELTDALEKVALAALADRKPGRLAWGRGRPASRPTAGCSRTASGSASASTRAGRSTDRLPVLRVTDPDGKVRAVLAGYACHCTTLGGEFNKICGDWAGYACDAIERDHPGATALVVIGCGADANPEPRRNLDDARHHGAAVAARGRSAPRRPDDPAARPGRGRLPPDRAALRPAADPRAPRRARRRRPGPRATSRGSISSGSTAARRCRRR